MIIQRVPAGMTPIVIRNVDHAQTAGQLARAFGNDLFQLPEPVHLMHFAVEHHEEGWRSIDDLPTRNPATGLPYHLAETPAAQLIEKSAASPAYNERHHPWCGLVSSMHSWGLYHNRYGISDAISIEQRPDAYADQIQRMLDVEFDRQERMKATLRRDATTAAWVEPDALMASYKLFEFFDTLALWMQLNHHSLRQPANFLHVPAMVGKDLAVEVSQIQPHAARISPYPFAQSPIELSWQVRALAPASNQTELERELAGRSFQTQHYSLTA